MATVTQKTGALTSELPDSHEIGFMLLYWSSQLVSWGDSHIFYSALLTLEICRGSSRKSNAVQPRECLQLAFPSLKELMQFKEQNFIKALVDGPVTTVTAEKASRKRQIPRTYSRTLYPSKKASLLSFSTVSTQDFCSLEVEKHSGALQVLLFSLQPPDKHQASILLREESNWVQRVNTLGWSKQTGDCVTI